MTPIESERGDSRRLGTGLLALVIMRLPLRRAVRFKPGEALRYA